MKLGRTVHCAKGRHTNEKVCKLAKKLKHQTESRREHRTYKYGVAKDLLSRAPFVSMVQAAHLRNGNDTTVLRPIYGSRLRGVFRQG